MEKAFPLQRILAETSLKALRATSRWQDCRRLLQHGFKAHAQTDEDGIIQEIFARIGTTSRRFIEIGVHSGFECNTAFLVLQGWSGTWLDADAASLSKAAENYIWARDRLTCIAATVRTDNINALLSAHSGQDDLDLLSIDVDGNDYWIWKAATVGRPRVVVIEYNATYPPPASIAVPYDAERKWDGTAWFGASIKALELLGHERGYALVGCNAAGVNAFFVRDDLVTDETFRAPFSAENHYEPPRYWLGRLPSGHTPGMGPWVIVT